jgi:plastocyanin
MSMSAGSSMSMSPNDSGATTITIHDFTFGGTASVAAWSTVTVTNQDSETHSVTANGAGGFDVTVPAGASRTFTAPSVAGTYAYHCLFHSDMHGMLRVR